MLQMTEVMSCFTTSVPASKRTKAAQLPHSNGQELGKWSLAEAKQEGSRSKAAQQAR